MSTSVFHAMATAPLLAALLLLSAVSAPTAAYRIPFSHALSSPSSSAASVSSLPTSLSDSLKPEAARAQLQATLVNLTAALRDNDTDAAAGYFADGALLLPPGAPARTLADLAAREAFVAELAACPATIQLTVADVLVGSVPLSEEAAAAEVHGSSGTPTVVARINYVLFTKAGALADAGKLLTQWTGTLVPPPPKDEPQQQQQQQQEQHQHQAASSASLADPPKQYTWELVLAIWSSDTHHRPHQPRIGVSTDSEGEALFDFDDSEVRGSSADATDSNDVGVDMFATALERALGVEEVEVLEGGAEALYGSGSGDAAAVQAQLQSQLDGFSEALREGDVVGAAGLFFPPSLELLAPGRPRSLVTTTLQLTRLLQGLIRWGVTLAPQVQHVQVLKVKYAPPLASAAAAAATAARPQLRGSDDTWAVAVGTLNVTNATSGEELLLPAKFVYVFAPPLASSESHLAESVGVSVRGSSRAHSFVLHTAAWNFNERPHKNLSSSLLDLAAGNTDADVLGLPSATHLHFSPSSPTASSSHRVLKEGESNGEALGSLKPEDAQAQLRDALAAFTAALNTNNTDAAAALLAPTAFLLAPGLPPQRLATPVNRTDFFDCVFSLGLRYQLTIVDVAVGKPQAFSPIPPAPPNTFTNADGNVNGNGNGNGNGIADGASNDDTVVALAYVNYVAFARGGALHDVGKLLLLWVSDGLSLSAPAGSVGNKPPAWKVYWVAFNSDVHRSPRPAAASLAAADADGASDEPMFDFGNAAEWAAEEVGADDDDDDSTVAAVAAVVGNSVKPTVVLQQLVAAVKQLSLAVAGNNTFLAAQIFAPSVLVLPEGSPARTIAAPEEKEALFQVLTDEGLELEVAFDEVVVAGLDFLSDGSASNDDPVYALTRGSFTVARNGSAGELEVVVEGHAVLVWQQDPKKSTAVNGPKVPPTFSIRWALWSHVSASDKPGAAHFGPLFSPSSPSASSSALDPSSAVEVEPVLNPEIATTTTSPLLGDPKPEEVRADLSALLFNLTLASSPEELLNLTLASLAPDVWVLPPSGPAVELADAASQSAFFSEFYAGAGVVAGNKLDFVLVDVASGKGAAIPAPPAPTPSSASNNNDQAVAVTTFLVLASGEGGAVSVYQAVALWVGAKVRSLSRSGLLGSDKFTWALSTLAWTDYVAPTVPVEPPAAPGPEAAESLSISSALRIAWQRQQQQQRQGGRVLMSFGAASESVEEEEDEEENVATTVVAAMAAGDRRLRGLDKLVWASLNESIAAAVANLSLGDIANASAILSPLHPVSVFAPGVNLKLRTAEERDLALEPLAGAELNVTLEEVWSLELKEEDVTLRGRSGAGSAFTRGTFSIEHDSGPFEGKFIALWDGIIAPRTDDANSKPEAQLGNTKASAWAIRWLLWSTTAEEPVAPAPAPAPAPATPQPDSEPTPPKAPKKHRPPPKHSKKQSPPPAALSPEAMDVADFDVAVM